MSPGYEAQQLRAFGRIIRNGHLYKGVKPVHWCLDCRSALAEAEVEYEEKPAPAIDVAFRVADRDDLAARIGVSATRLGTTPVELVIWTTTPWTLPGNQAIALRAEFRYALAQAGSGGERRGLIVAAELLESSLRRFGLPGAAVLAQFEGDRKSTRLNSSHLVISYAVFCLKKKKTIQLCVQSVTARREEVAAVSISVPVGAAVCGLEAPVAEGSGGALTHHERGQLTVLDKQ